MKTHSIIILFLILNFFLLILSVPDLFDLSFDLTHANNLNFAKNIGLHEYEYFGVLNVILSKISILNISISIFFFISICSLGYIFLSKSSFNYIFNELQENENKIILFVGSFSFGSLIFVGIYRLLSFNISINYLNKIFLIYIVVFIFYYFYKSINNFKILNKYKSLNFFIILIFVFIILIQIDMGNHHIIGDAFYNYGYSKIIKTLIYSEHVPLIGSHYFEELFIFPLIYFLQDFFYFSNLEYTSFQVMWLFQAFGKLSSICLIYIFFRIFKSSRLQSIFFTIIVFTTNLSGHYFYNPVLYDSGNPFLLTVHSWRSSGLIVFIFICSCYFLKQYSIKSNFDYLLILLLAVGISSLGIQYSFLFIIFFIFIYLNKISSIKFINKSKTIINNKFQINNFVCIFFILFTYVLIGQSIKTYYFAPYLLLLTLILCLLNFYSLKLHNLKFTSKGFLNLNLFFLLFFIILCFFGNIFTYKFLFTSSPSQIEILQKINESFFSYISHANKMLVKGEYIYRSLIHFEEQNFYKLKNICTLRFELNLKIAGIPSFHCSKEFVNLLFGLGFIFSVLIINTYLVKNLVFSKNYKENFILFLYSLSLFLFVFSLFFNDMIDGRYMVHPRTRFLEISSVLVIIVFLLIISNYIKEKIHYKIIYTVLLLKIILPFGLNFIDDKSWYLKQFLENIKYLVLIN